MRLTIKIILFINILLLNVIAQDTVTTFIKQFGSGEITCSVWTPDGKHIVAGSREGNVYIFDYETENLVKTFPVHTDLIRQISLSADGKYIITKSSDQTIKLIDINNGIIMRSFEGPNSDPYFICISNDNNYLMTVVYYDDHLCKIWDINRNALVKVYNLDSIDFRPFSFSNDSKSVLAIKDNKIIRVWDISNKDLFDTLFILDTNFISDNGIDDAFFSNDENSIITTSNYESIHWNLDGTIILKIEHPYEAQDVIISRDFKYLHAIDLNKLKTYDLSTGKLLYDFNIGNSDKIYDVSVSPDNRYVLTSSFTSHLKMGDISTGKLAKTIGYNIEGVDISNDGNFLVSRLNDTAALLIDINTGLIHKKLIGHLDYISSLSFSSDNKYVLSSSFDNTARIWDVKTGNELKRFTGHTRNVISGKLSKDGQFAVTFSADNLIKVWNTSTLDEIRQFSDSDTVKMIALSPDDKKLFVISDKTVSILDFLNGSLHTRYPIDYFLISAISTDTRYLFTLKLIDTFIVIQVLDLENGNIINQIPCDINTPYFGLSSNGKYISVSLEKQIKFFDVLNGKLVKIIMNNPNRYFTYSSFSENNNSILISNDLGCCYLFPIDDIAPAFQRQINNKDNPFLIINGRNIGFKNIPVSFNSQKEPILTLFSLNGKSIARINQTLFNCKSNPGYSINFHLPYNLAPGTYLYNLSSGNKSIKGRMSLNR